MFRILKGEKLINIPYIYEVCTTSQGIITLEEYVDGVLLDKILEKKTLTRKEACNYATNICDALSSLHSHGIIHCDIKPSNIIIGKDGKANLIDLSISKSANGDDMNSIPLGTPGFAAPEQFGIAKIDYVTDIYALGVMLNIMLTGNHPTAKCYGGHLGKIISKAISTEMSKRYKTAKDFKKALKFYTI